MNTVILKWNPAISSYKMDNHIHAMYFYPDCDYNWSVWEHERAHSGDRFFLVRVGEGKTGVVMSGILISEPYRSEDWSGRGRETYYMDMYPDHIFHPDYAPLLTTEQLEQSLPGVEWRGGHSGVVLSEEDAATLEAVWQQHLASLDDSLYEDEIDEINVESAVRHEPCTIDAAILLACIAHFGQTDLDGNPVILHPLSVGLMGKNREEMIVGFLHDVIEDCRDYSARDMLKYGIDYDIVETLKLLTHSKGTDYYEYIQRIIDSGNEVAIAVKRNDLRHNLRRGRAGGHTRIVAKHKKAWAMIGGGEPE